MTDPSAGLPWRPRVRLRTWLVVIAVVGVALAGFREIPGPGLVLVGLIILIVPGPPAVLLGVVRARRVARGETESPAVTLLAFLGYTYGWLGVLCCVWVAVVSILILLD